MSNVNPCRILVKRVKVWPSWISIKSINFLSIKNPAPNIYPAHTPSCSLCHIRPYNFLILIQKRVYWRPSPLKTSLAPLSISETLLGGRPLFTPMFVYQQGQPRIEVTPCWFSFTPPGGGSEQGAGWEWCAEYLLLRLFVIETRPGARPQVEPSVRWLIKSLSTLRFKWKSVSTPR